MEAQSPLPLSLSNPGHTGIRQFARTWEELIGTLPAQGVPELVAADAQIAAIETALKDATRQKAALQQAIHTGAAIEGPSQEGILSSGDLSSSIEVGAC